jgi:hypothetical protein
MEKTRQKCIDALVKYGFSVPTLSKLSTRRDGMWISPVPNFIETGQEILNTKANFPSRQQVINL